MTEAVCDIARRHGAAPQDRRCEDFPVLRAPAATAPALHAALRGAGYTLLADLWGVDARAEGEMRLASHLISLERDADLRIEVPLDPHAPEALTVAASHANAAWYEREAWDMFGIRFDAPERHVRILNPPTWQGHPLLKDAPARATEEPPFRLPADRFAAEEAALQADTADLGLPADTEVMVLNFGPHHPSTHGVFRVILALEGERIVAACPDIGYHHRGVEKMAERQTWHGFIPYTDRVDYLGGTTSELPYLMAVERLAGIEIPDRARVTRIMLAELFRVMNHLLFLGTMAQDTGALSPVFYMFRDRERIYDAIEAITGARMHPGFFRIGGMSLDLPEGWQAPMRDLLDWMPGRLDDYDRMVLDNEIFRARTVDVAPMDTEFALAWGITGPMLRATGCAWDWRRARPYLGYEALDFDIPVGAAGDCWDRTKVRLEEMRQSLGIVRQCVDGMPGGPIKADHPLTTPPPRERMLHDIETLVQHFMGVTWGPNLPAGHATGQVESVRGLTQYAATSNGGAMAERLRIRTPSFAHLQSVAEMAPGLSVADFVAFLGSVDFVMSDVDR